VVERRQFGCLGGPLVYEVPMFALRLADGRCVSVDAGPDPMLLNAFRLPSPAPPQTMPFPQRAPVRTDLAGTLYHLTGRVRVSGVFFLKHERLAPPAGRSATIEIL